MAFPHAFIHHLLPQGPVRPRTIAACLCIITSSLLAGETRPYRFTVTVTIEGEGVVTPNGGTFDVGTAVQLTAVPAEGWHFVRWGGDISGITNFTRFTVYADVAVTAVFEPDPPSEVSLDTRTDGQGTVEPNGGTFPYGATIELTATPASGWHFVGWDGDLSGSSNPVTLVMDENKNVAAVFEQDPPILRTLTIQVSGLGWVCPSGGTYYDGQTVELTPIGDSGSAFIRWSGDVSSDQESAQPLSVLLDRNRTITAVFGDAPVPPTPVCTVPQAILPSIFVLGAARLLYGSHRVRRSRN